MTINRVRGEVLLTICDRQVPAVLTLGALAEIEANAQAESLHALFVRFSEGRVRSSDMIVVMKAGIRAAGAQNMCDEIDEVLSSLPMEQAVSNLTRLFEGAFSTLNQQDHVP